MSTAHPADARRTAPERIFGSHNEKPNIDDIVHAYRWLLGREPESLRVIEQHLAAAPDRAVLRRRILLSREFAQKFRQLSQERQPASPIQPLDREIERFVFLHIPKTGGSTLHALLSDAVGADLVSTERHNGLWRCSGAELAGMRLFSGHYDRRCLSFVPGRNVRVVTMLREPAARLLSLYKFLRAHSPRLVVNNNLALAAAARELTYGKFLEAALQLNPATVDNTYLRAFGAYLPSARWEQAAEPSGRNRLEGLGLPVYQLLERATLPRRHGRGRNCRTLRQVS
jgi:hypothetical protein